MFLIIPIIFLWICYYLVRKFFLSKLKVSGLDKKPVLITGCDSGFGRATALRLDKAGVQVYAACLTQKGADDLHKQGSERLRTFVMDVTDEASVENAYNQLKDDLSGTGLWALINNAGVLRAGPLEALPLADWRLQLNVNVMGIAITTKKFLPLIRKAKGRIVNIASVAGRFATGGTSAYNASKFAVEGLSDSWRRELKVWGINVILVEPGIMKTPLWDVPVSTGFVDRLWNELSAEDKQLYGREFFEASHKSGQELVAKLGGDPVQVVDALQLSVSERFPPRRYTVGGDTPLWIFLAETPAFISDVLSGLLMKGPKPKALQK